MERLAIHPRVMQRHPQLCEENVRYAWTHAYYEAVRSDSPNFPEYLWIGVDESGRELEMVGVPTEDGWLVYHANTPLSARTKHELKKAKRG